MEYAAALEEKANAQVERIIELEASVEGQTVLSKATNFAASSVTTGGDNKDLKELHAAMKQLTCSSPRGTFFLHALSFECTSKLCITFLNQFSVYFHI